MDDEKYWVGSNPVNCQLCNTPIVDTFVDGKTTKGPWALLCSDCHAEYDVGIGTGKGQRYELIDGVFTCVEG